MKKCPFCAEEIQDAAIVCKHCGRDLIAQPVVPAGKPKRHRWLIAFGFLFALGLIGMVIQQDRASTANERDSAGKCVLHARGAVVTTDAPIAQAMHWSSDVLAIRSLDTADWKDLEVTIFGFVTTGTRGKQQTGAYRKKKTLSPEAS